jgi:hypothetical protein
MEGERMSDEEYIAELARRVQPVIIEHHYHIGTDAIAHIIAEALWHASRDIRSGRTVPLECIGKIRLDNGEPRFAWDEWLTTPLPGKPQENAA